MTKIISQVVEVIGDIMSVRIRINQLDRLIRMIHEELKWQELVKQVNTLSV